LEQLRIHLHETVKTQKDFLGQDAPSHILPRKSGNAIGDGLARHWFGDQ
jgi:hypothetical protein